MAVMIASPVILLKRLEIRVRRFIRITFTHRGKRMKAGMSDFLCERMAKYEPAGPRMTVREWREILGKAVSRIEARTLRGRE